MSISEKRKDQQSVGIRVSGGRVKKKYDFRNPTLLFFRNRKAVAGV